MAGRCVVISIIFFRDQYYRDLGIEAYLVLSFVLGNSGYLLLLPVGLAISCCCDPDRGVFLKVYFNHVVCLSCTPSPLPARPCC